MKFSLSKSPLRNFNKYDSDNIYELLLPFVRDFACHQHELADTPLPPGAFLIRGEDCHYYNGYQYQSSSDFLAELAIDSETADAVITFAEFGTMEQDFSQGLVLIVAQTRQYYRCRAFRMTTGESFDILDEPFRIVLPPDDDAPDGENICHLLGIDELLHPLF